MGDWRWTGNGWEHESSSPAVDNSATSMLPVYAAADAEPVITADPPTGPIPQVTFLEPVATTAGEQDHSDPWIYAGEEAEAPENP